MSYASDFDDYLVKKDSLLNEVDATPLDEAGAISVLSGHDLVGNRIYIPNAKNPLFSVDENGNLKVKSLERDDFHWFTVFESLDGFSTDGISVRGSITISSNGITIKTGDTYLDYAELQKSQPNSTANGFSWDKDRKLKLHVQLVDSTNQNIYLVCGDGTTSNGRKFGFYVVNNTLYGITADNSGNTTLSLGTFDATNFKLLEAKYFAGKRVEFYVNKTYIGKITTNLPSGDTISGNILDFHIITTGNVAKTVNISYFDFWQRN